jgi:hypothetical protein
MLRKILIFAPTTLLYNPFEKTAMQKMVKVIV